MINEAELLRIVGEEVHRAFRYGMRSMTRDDALQQTLVDVLRVLSDKGAWTSDNGGLVRVVARSQLSRAQRFTGRRLRPVRYDVPGTPALEDSDDETAPDRVLSFDPWAETEAALACRQAEDRWRKETGADPLAGRSTRQAEHGAIQRAADWLKANRRPFDP